jgi:two-component sensor histidine kinase
MLKYFQKLSIKTQLLVFIIPVILLIATLNSYLDYTTSIAQLINRENEKKENIKSGVKQYVDNYDLSLKLIEISLEQRLKSIYNQLIGLNVDFSKVNLDSLRDKYNLNKKKEDLYVIDTTGKVINTTFDIDLGLNFYDFGESYKEFLKNVWKNKELNIERVANEDATDTPKKYAYQAINDNLILEVGIQSSVLDSLISDLDLKLDALADRYENISSIDLFGGSEALKPKNKGATISNSLKSVAYSCLNNKKDTTVISHSLNTVYTDFIYIEMRDAEYFKGYILQIVSDNSLQSELLKKETKSLILNVVCSIVLVIILIFFITKKVTKPLEVLTKKVSEMADASELKPIHILGSIETKTLSDKFNLLSTQIKDLQTNLQTKIDERTKEVTGKNIKLEKLLVERETLLKEIHHRVKNNLQIISSLLHLQSRTVKTQEAKEAFEQSINRVSAMGLLHEKLYKNSNFISVNASSYLNDLIQLFKKSIRNNISIVQHVDDIKLNASQAISVGLIINEFISNSIKHAFDEEESGEITIDLHKKNDKIILTLSNNGKLLPDDFEENSKNSLGMTIIEAFTEKLEGQFKYQNISNGVALKVEFPVETL